MPVDSEHSAIFQALQAGDRQDVRRVILTSSGGPFRGKTRARAGGRHARGGPQAPDLADGPEDHDRLGHAHEQGARGHRGALALRPRARADRGGDPPRERGPLDGRVRRRQRGRPALAARHAVADPVCPHLPGPASLPRAAARPDATYGPALRAARPRDVSLPGPRLRGDDAAEAPPAPRSTRPTRRRSSRFLGGEIGFLDIPRACRAALDHHTFDPRPSLDQLWKVDAWARLEVQRWKP